MTSRYFEHFKTAPAAAGFGDQSPIYRALFCNLAIYRRAVAHAASKARA
jgi:hypothetical protein